MPGAAEDRGTRDLAIVGAGPVGLEAAALAVAAGLDAVVLEAGRVAEHVARWGHVRLFSPFEMNAGPGGLRRLRQIGAALPDDDEIMRGAEFRQRYLLPLAADLRREIRVCEGTRTVGITRAGLLKGEALGSERRAAAPFRLLIERDGSEEELFARSVFDCSGTYGRPNWAGPGGGPARGERTAGPLIEYHVPRFEGPEGERFAGVRTLVLGGGHSAATAVLGLAGLADRAGGTAFVWATRRGGKRALEPIPGDPLPERDALVRRANALAAAPPPGSAWWGGATLAAVRAHDDGFEVEISVDGPPRRERFARIVANVGYEPDDGLYRQLQIHECYATRGPMKLAAALMAASGAGTADCLATGSLGPETLGSPEPGFFILGIKSYGKNSAFLMRTGYEQAADAVSLIAVAAAAR